MTSKPEVGCVFAIRTDKRARVYRVLRQNLIRVENGLIPCWHDLNMTGQLNKKAPPIGLILCSRSP